MRSTFRLRFVLSMLLVGLIGFECAEFSSPAKAQEVAKAEPETLEAIENAYFDEISTAELKRLDRIAGLAEKKAGAESEDLWRYYFESIVEQDLFMKAEANANKLLEKKDLPIDIRFMAEVTHIIAEARRGELDASLESVRKLFAKARENAQAVEEIPTHLKLGLVEIYLRTIVDAGRYDLANKAIEMILAESNSVEIKDYLTGEKASLARVGKPAPDVKGMDVDERPFDLATLKGKPVLILFWATWDEVSKDQIDEIVSLTESYKDKGLEVVTINVDRLREDAEPPAEVAMEVRRFLIERNLLWKSLVCGDGDSDFAEIFGVRYLPSNIVIDRAGIIRHVDRSPSGLAQAIKEVCE